MLEICSRVENGKAYLEFEVEPYRERAHTIWIQIYERDGREVLRCIYSMAEEEPARGILLHPHLWNGQEDPYLYCTKITVLNAAGEMYESKERSLALRTVEEIPGKGWFLNDRPFAVRAVRLDGTEFSLENLKAELVGCTLKQISDMGANTISLPMGAATVEFRQLCDEMGLVMFETSEAIDEVDRKGVTYKELFCRHSSFCTDTYYRYKAMWSRIPFVYISMNSLKKGENGTMSVLVYSNQKKVALYVDGVLFEFLTGGGEYLFEQIPVKKYPVVLTAEAGECSMAVTIYEHSETVAE